MTNPEVGSARVRIVPDPTGFSAQLKTDLRTILSNLGKAANVRITPDITGFAAKLKSDLRSATSDLGKAASVRITPDTTGFLNALRRDVRAATTDVGTAARVRITPDLTGFAATLKRDLRAITSNVGTASRVRITPDFTNFASGVRRSVKDATAGVGSAAKVRILPDFTGFVGSIKREIRDATSNVGPSARVRIEPDLTGFSLALRRELRNIMANLGTAPRVRIEPDFSGFAESVRRGVRDATSRVGSAGNVPITADVSGLRNALGSIAGVASIYAIGNAAIEATAHVIELAASISKLGLEQANILQTGEISFEALASEISGATGAVDNLSLAQRQAISNGFLESLRAIAVETSISLDGLIKNSQALLALGNDGENSKNIILTVGNALAASGRSGARLNQDLDGVIIAFSQISGAGRLLAQDLNQITTRIPAASRVKVYNEIAQNLGLIADKAKASDIELVKARQSVIKMAEQGQISAELAIGSILRVLQEIPGAVNTATREASALKRINEQTLSGAFEEVADRFRQALGTAFKGAADKITPELSAFGGRIEGLVQGFVGPLTTLVTSIVQLISDNADVISQGLGKAFTGLADALTILAPHIPEVISGLQTLYDTIRNISVSSDALFGIAAVTAFINPLWALVPFTAAIATTPGALDSVREAFSNLQPVIEPIISIVDSIGQVISNLGPVLDGATAAISSLTPILDGVALTFRLLADVLSGTLNSDFGTFVGFLLTMVGIGTFGIVVGLPALIGAITAAMGGLVTAFWALDAAIAANPIGAAIIALTLLAAAFVYAWKHSETFRDIVVGVFHTLAEVETAWVRIVLFGFEKVLEGADNLASHIPLIGHTLGSGFGKAADGVRALRGEIDALVDSIYNIPTGSPQVSKIPGLDSGMGAGDTQRIHPQGNVTSVAATPKFDYKLGVPKLDLGPQQDLERLKAAEKEAKDAAAESLRLAKEAAAKIVSAIKSSLSDIATIRKKIDTKSIDTIESQFSSLYDHLQEANQKLLINTAKTYEKILTDLATQRDTIKDTLTEAKQAFKSLVDEADQFKKKIEDSVTAMGNVTEKPKGIRTTIAGITNNLTNAIKTADQFRTAVVELQKRGLNKDSLRQIIEAGPEAGLAAAKALAKAGDDRIAQVNELQSNLSSISIDLGTSLHDDFYKSGISAAQGLVDGLQSQESAIEAQMVKMADKIVAILKAALKVPLATASAAAAAKAPSVSTVSTPSTITATAPAVPKIKAPVAPKVKAPAAPRVSAPPAPSIQPTTGHSITLSPQGPGTPFLPAKQPAVITGLRAVGNIDLKTASTLRSISQQIDGRIYLIPIVDPTGKVMTTKEAVDLFRRTGKNFGIFDSPAHADAYASKLRSGQALKKATGGFIDGPGGIDNVPAWLTRHEFVMPVKQSAQYASELLAMRAGTYQAPKIEFPKTPRIECPNTATPRQTLTPVSNATSAGVKMSREIGNSTSTTVNRSYTQTITVPVTVQGSADIPDQQRARIMGDTLARVIAHRQQGMMLDGVN